MTLETSTLRRSFWSLLAAFWVLALAPGRDPEPFHAGHPRSFWLRELDEKAPQISPEAADAFRSMGEAAWPSLRERLIRRTGWAHRALLTARLQVPRRFIPADSTEPRRSAVLAWIASLDSMTANQIRDLAEGLRATRQTGSRDVIAQLLGAQGASAAPTLAVLVLDTDPEVQRVALRALRPILDDPDLVEPLRLDLATVISTQLGAADSRVVVESGEALMAVADVVPGAVPILLDRLSDVDPEVRTMSAELLGRIGEREGSRCVEALAACLDDVHPRVRTAAAAALGRFGARAVPVVPRLTDLVETGPTAVRVAAVRALGRIGPSAVAAVPVLATCVGRTGAPSIVRSGAAAALRRISGRADLAVPALARALGDPDGAVREGAAEALAAFGSHATSALPELIDALGDPRESVRILATEALGHIGPTAAKARPALQAARDNNPSVMSRPVLDALARIEGPQASP